MKQEQPMTIDKLPKELLEAILIRVPFCPVKRKGLDGMRLVCKNFAAIVSLEPNSYFLRKTGQGSYPLVSDSSVFLKNTSHKQLRTLAHRDRKIRSIIEQVPADVVSEVAAAQPNHWDQDLYRGLLLMEEIREVCRYRGRTETSSRLDKFLYLCPDDACVLIQYAIVIVARTVQHHAQRHYNDLPAVRAGRRPPATIHIPSSFVGAFPSTKTISRMIDEADSGSTINVFPDVELADVFLCGRYAPEAGARELLTSPSSIMPRWFWAVATKQRVLKKFLEVENAVADHEVWRSLCLHSAAGVTQLDEMKHGPDQPDPLLSSATVAESIVSLSDPLAVIDAELLDSNSKLRRSIRDSEAVFEKAVVVIQAWGA